MQNSKRREKSEILLSNLAQLQNKIKRDSVSYKEEFMIQLRNFANLKEIFLTQTTTMTMNSANTAQKGSAQNGAAQMQLQNSAEFNEIINFLSQVAVCYKKEIVDFISDLLNLLENYYLIMNNATRWVCRLLFGLITN